MHSATHKTAMGFSPAPHPDTAHSTIRLTAHGLQRTAGADGGIRIDIAQLPAHLRAADRRARRQAQSTGVRALLQRALCAGPSMRLYKTPAGQPRWDNPGAPHITLAHSGAWLACAVASAHPVGVDIECLRPRDWEQLAPAALHPAEARWVLGATGPERDVRGLTAWCRREALAKSLGLGLDAPWSWTTVAFDPVGRLIAAPAQLGDAAAWTSFSSVIDNQAVLAAVWRRADRAANDAVAA